MYSILEQPTPLRLVCRLTSSGGPCCRRSDSLCRPIHSEETIPDTNGHPQRFSKKFDSCAATHTFCAPIHSKGHDFVVVPTAFAPPRRSERRGVAPYIVRMNTNAPVKSCWRRVRVLQRSQSPVPVPFRSKISRISPISRFRIPAPPSSCSVFRGL